MLLLLRRNQAPKLRNFKIKILFVSIFLHIIILFFGLFTSFNDTLKIEIKNSRTGVPIVFLPFTKKVPGSLNTLKRISSNNNEAIVSSKSKIKIALDTKISKIRNQNKKKLSHENKIEKNEEIKNKKIYLNNNKGKINKLKKQINEDIKKKSNLKDQEKIIKNEIKKSQEVKEEEKILNSEEKLQVTSTQEKNIDKQNNEILEEAIYVGRHDLIQIETEELIRYQIETNWRPPAGLPKNLSCSVKIIIQNDGITKIDILKSSKSIAYDLSIKKSCINAVFPKDLWGKEFILNFSGQN